MVANNFIMTLKHQQCFLYIINIEKWSIMFSLIFKIFRSIHWSASLLHKTLSSILTWAVANRSGWWCPWKLLRGTGDISADSHSGNWQVVFLRSANASPWENTTDSKRGLHSHAVNEWGSSYTAVPHLHTWQRKHSLLKQRLNQPEVLSWSPRMILKGFCVVVSKPDQLNSAFTG